MTNLPPGGVDSKRVFRIHLGLVLAEVICVPAFAFELYRALGGNELSWAYVVEWPLLGGYAVHMWRKMLREERGLSRPRPPHVAKSDATSDEQLARWNEYLAAVHRTDQPGTPDQRSE